MGILLEMKKINKSFGSNLVLQDVSLELHEGEVLALLGEKIYFNKNIRRHLHQGLRGNIHSRSGGRYK